MKIMSTKCDNPGCDATDTPEEIKPYIPPYGWLRVKCDIIGCGPSVTVEVCGTSCVEAALDNAIAESKDR